MTNNLTIPGTEYFLVLAARSLMPPGTIPYWDAWVESRYDHGRKASRVVENLAISVLAARAASAGHGVSGWYEWASDYLKNGKSLACAEWAAKAHLNLATTCELDTLAATVALAVVKAAKKDDEAEDARCAKGDARRALSDALDKEKEAMAQVQLEKLKQVNTWAAGDEASAGEAERQMACRQGDETQAVHEQLAAKDAMNREEVRVREATAEAHDIRLQAFIAMAKAAGIDTEDLARADLEGRT